MLGQGKQRRKEEAEQLRWGSVYVPGDHGHLCLRDREDLFPWHDCEDRVTRTLSVQQHLGV